MQIALQNYSIDYELHGAGRPVIFLHGVRGDRNALLHSCEAVFAEREYRRIYLDLPGHGASQSLQSEASNSSRAALASADSLVQFLGELIASLCKDEPPLIVGYSYGGYLALALAASALPIAGLHLICPVVEPDFLRRTLPAQKVLLHDPALAFSDTPDEQSDFEAIAVIQSHAVLERFRAEIHTGNRAANDDFVAALREQYVASKPIFSRLTDFTKPVALLCGRDDFWVGFQDAAKLAAALPAASLQVVPFAGHLLPIEAREAFEQSLASWLERVEALAAK